MNKLFWLGLAGWILFESSNVYFIMPMPGSQQMNSLDLAYFLYTWRWLFRALFAGLILLGFRHVHWKKKWHMALPFAALLGVIYLFNFNMAADHMFYQPSRVIFKNASQNEVDSNRLVIGLTHQGEAKAYPVRFMGYHHQLLDTVGGKAVLVTYCTVCRTGRVYEPRVNGKPETFRLVGMDHFNAMLEDKTTKSWWRQVNGEAVAGKLKGSMLPEVFSIQCRLEEWIKLHPHTLIMQADSTYIDSYPDNNKFESGKSKSKLTGTDSLSWNRKSWVVGIRTPQASKAYDWNRLKSEWIIHDEVRGTPVLLVLASDTASFFAFERPGPDARFTLERDTLYLDQHRFDLKGRGLDTTVSLKPLQAYQEFWHSWETFNPGTLR
ncbi:MAG TPA: DUF3179 domain-containing (seleno)protein [Saprospiraceae bacterium]|nr:DUF3179 domain-containing (seleno)protein [Saprospiraceae bacterium]